jgi:hypothetical protein
MNWLRMWSNDELLWPQLHKNRKLFDCQRLKESRAVELVSFLFLLSRWGETVSVELRPVASRAPS